METEPAGIVTLPGKVYITTSMSVISIKQNSSEKIIERIRMILIKNKYDKSYQGKLKEKCSDTVCITIIFMLV